MLRGRSPAPLVAAALAGVAAFAAVAAVGSVGSVGAVAIAAELPVAVPPATVTTDEDVAVQVTLSGTDADGDLPLVFSVIDGPANGTLGAQATPICDPGPPSSCETTVDYTPNPDAYGPDAFTFGVNDGADGQSMPATVHIEVTAVNDDPVAVDDVATVVEDEITHILVLLNDLDADNDPLLITDATHGVHGTVEIVGSGNNIHVQYAPDPDFIGTDSFTYTVTDAKGGPSDTATVSITVDPVNDDPVATDDNVSGVEDRTTHVVVLGNDGDADGDDLSIVDSTDGAHGTTEILDNPNGERVVYTPAQDFNGEDSFTYTVGDGNGGEATGTVTIDVAPVNDAPTLIVPFEAVVDEDAGAQSFGGFLDCEVGPPDEEPTQACDFTIAAVSPTALFSVQPAVNPNGTLTFTSAPNANGIATVTAQVVDGGGTENQGVEASAPQQFTITINAIDDPPTATDDGTPTPIQVGQNLGPVPIDVLANDASPDAGETIAITAVTQGANGAVAITGGGSRLTYDPTGSFTGADTFTYTISDGALLDTATVHVTIAPDITAPVASIRVVVVASPGSASVRATVTWSAVELQSGISLYQLQQQTDGGAWVNVPLTPVTATRVERVLAAGHDYAFRVRAKDGIGNQGSFATSRPVRL